MNLTQVSQRLNFGTKAKWLTLKEISKYSLSEELGSIVHTHEDLNLTFT